MLIVLLPFIAVMSTTAMVSAGRGRDVLDISQPGVLFHKCCPDQ